MLETIKRNMQAGQAELAKSIEALQQAAEQIAALTKAGDALQASLDESQRTVAALTLKCASEKARADKYESAFGRLASSLGLSFATGEKPIECMARCVAKARELQGLELDTEAEQLAEEERRAKEERRNAALAQLTQEQRDALGL